MKKRLLSMLCVFLICFQLIPIYAEAATSPYTVPDGYTEIKTAEEFKNIKSGGKYYIHASTDIDLGEYQIPKFSGSIIGGGKVSYIPISNDGYIGLFKELTNATIDIWVQANTLKMKEAKYSSSMYIGVLAAKAKNVKLGNMFSAHYSYFATDDWNEFNDYYKLPSNIENLIIGKIFAITEGTIELNDANGEFENYTNYQFRSDTDAPFVPYDAKNLVLGGTIGEVKSGKVSLPTISTTLEEPRSDNISKNRNDTNIIVGCYGIVNSGATIEVSSGGFDSPSLEIELESSPKSLTGGTIVGVLEDGATLSRASNFEDYDLVVNGPIDNLIVGTIVGENKGNLKFSSARLITDIALPQTECKNIIIGGLVGKNSGKIDAYSYGANFFAITDIKENLKMGVTAGVSDGIINLYDTGNYVSCYNNSEEPLNCGFVGEIKNLDKASFGYNIVDIDEDDGKKDIEFKPFNNLDINKKGFKEFKNNYLGYMRIIELYKPEHVYMVRPINAHGDTPPDIKDDDFPFLAYYTPLVSDENREFVEVKNPSKRGMATVTLNKDVPSGIRVEFSVIASDAKDYWLGHLYENTDISAYNERHKTEEPDNVVIQNNMQAVIVGSIAAGGPLPMKNKNVSFNYYNLPYEYVETNVSFIDIAGDLFEKEILNAANRLIVNGVGNNLFEPKRSITRAEFATMAVKALGLIPVDQQMFDDVKSGSWYYEYVNAAAQWNIIVGVGGGKFLPDNNITREEAMVIVERIYNEILIPNVVPTLKEATYTQVEDANVSDWAINGAMFNMANKIVPLRDNYLMPKELLTRNETAATFINLLKLSNLID